MEGRLGKTTRHPVMKLLIDFRDLGYEQKDNWVDITDDILDLSGSKEKSGRQIGSVTSDIATFTTDNIDNKYSNDNPNSPFKGKIKSNLKFRLLTGFQGETLIPYASGYIEAFSPSWREKRIHIKATDYFKLFKEKEVPEDSFQDISWDALVNILCNHVGLPNFIVRNIPKTEFYYNYFKFEEENCFEALKALMEIAVGEAYFEQEQFYVKTKLALDYQLDTTVDHDITVDDLFDFEENVDGQNIINSLSVSSQYKTIAPLEVVFSTPDNVVKIENEQIKYTGGNYINIDSKNLPMINNEENPITIKNLTQGRTIYINGHNPKTGRIDIHPDSLAYLGNNDILSVSYSYQQLALLAGQTRKYTFVMNQEVDSLHALDIAVWDEEGDQKRNYSETANTPNTVSKQGMTFDKKTNTVTLTLKNNYPDPTTISTLQLRGYPIKIIAPIEVHVKDLPSISEFGKKETSFQNNYLNNIKLAEKIGQYIVDNNKGNRKRINIDIAGYPEFSLDDISKVTEASSGTSHKFTNERIDYTFSPDSGWNVKSALLELDSTPWVYESFKGESWQKTDSGTPDGDFLKDINANLIKNGGAELYTGFSDYNDIGAISQKHIIPDYWRFIRLTGNATSRIRDGGNLVLHGHHSFEITTSNSGAGYFEQIINGIKPSAIHTLSFVASPTACSGKASVLQYANDVLVQEDSISITSHGVYELIISSLASTNAVVVRIEKLAGAAGSESLVFDKVKFENSKEKTTYIENEETTSVQVGQRYANSLLIGNQYGLEVIDDLNNTRVRIGQYRPNKYGIEVHGGAIEFIGGLPAKQVNIGIGAKNLVRGSDNPKNSSTYLLGLYTMSEDWEPNTEYTISIYGFVNAGQSFGIWANGSATMVATLPYTEGDVVTYLTFKTPAAIETTTASELRIYNYPSATATNGEITATKLERGNVKTDFSLAPEDVDEKITEGLNNVTVEYNAAIEAKADEINLGVAQKIVDSEGNIREYVGSQIQATEDSFGIRFLEIDNTTGKHETDIAEMHSYFQFKPTGLNIGKSDSPLQINISNEQMDFIDNGNTVAYVNGQKMYIDSLEVLTNLIVGNHKIEKYNNNITLIKWVGE